MTARFTPAAFLLLAAACGVPGDADIAPSDYARSAPNPTLLPDETFRAAAAEAAPVVARIDAETAALAARAEALQARATALGGPVVDPAVRPRLIDAADGPPDPS